MGWVGAGHDWTIIPLVCQPLSPTIFLTSAANSELSEQTVVSVPSPSPGHTPISGLWTNQTANGQAVWRAAGELAAL